MTDGSIVTQLPLWSFFSSESETPEKPPDFGTLWRHPKYLPGCVTSSPTILRCLELLSPLDWAHFPERNVQRNWGRTTIPYGALIAAELVRLNEGLPSMGRLRRFLIEHPGFIWLLGFPLSPAPGTALGFNPLTSLPTYRHFTRMMRTLPNSALQFLLADSVRLILDELHAQQIPPPDCISLDTKHILAWVQ